MFCATYLSNFWLNGGVLYGIPPGVTHPRAWERTMDMLDFAVNHLLCACVGPRFLSGDWNFEPHQVRAWNTLESAGWIEIQDLWERLSGQVPQKTCKAKTRKDYLWISPELARLFVSLDFHDTFDDHLVMRATFKNHCSVINSFGILVNMKPNQSLTFVGTLIWLAELLSSEHLCIVKDGQHLSRKVVLEISNQGSMVHQFCTLVGSNNSEDSKAMSGGRRQITPPVIGLNVGLDFGIAFLMPPVSNRRLQHGGTVVAIVALLMC